MDKNKKSITKKRGLFAGIFLLLVIGVVAVTVKSVYFENKLTVEDLLNHEFTLAFDPTTEIVSADLHFSENSVTVTKNYKDVVHSDPGEMTSQQNEATDKGQTNDSKTYKNLKIKVSNNKYMITSDGYEETFTRVDEERIKDTNDVEYVKSN